MWISWPYRNRDASTPCDKAPLYSIVPQELDGDYISKEYFNGIWNLPPGTVLAELDLAWTLSAYITLRLDTAKYPPSTETYPAKNEETELNVELPRNWLVDGAQGANVRMQGTGKLPDDNLGGRYVKYHFGNEVFSILPTNDSPGFGRVPFKSLVGNEYKAIAAPQYFPNQAQLFTPAIGNENPTKWLSVEDNGGGITHNQRRLDVYIGLKYPDEAYGLWEGTEVTHRIWALFDVPVNAFGVDDDGTCTVPDVIEPVQMRGN